MRLRSIRIRSPRQIIEEFKREARALFPKEAFAYLLGTDAGTLVDIEELYIPLDVSEQSSPGAVVVDRRWLAEARKNAKEHGLKVVGDIHSHPWRHGDLRAFKPDCEPSAADMERGMQWVTGICQVIERKNGVLCASIRFWGPMYPVTEEIV